MSAEIFRLYKVRPGDDTYVLIEKILELCEKKNLNLSRWQTNSTRNAYVQTITWGIHKEARTSYSKGSNLIYKVILSQPEGKTDRSTAYQELETLYEQLLNHKE